MPTEIPPASVKAKNDALASPWLNPKAALISLRATIVTVATALLSITGPLHTFLDKVHPGLASNVGAVCLVIVALGASHLGMARSILPGVDNPGGGTASAAGQESEANVSDGP